MILIHLLVLVCIVVSMGQGKGEKVIEEAEKVIEEAVVEDEKPNIIFIMVDDVGWEDFDYNTPGSSAIPTPNIFYRIKLKTHYVHPTCTPSRVAFMTGRYSANTGLPFAMYPGKQIIMVSIIFYLDRVCGWFAP